MGTASKAYLKLRNVTTGSYLFSDYEDSGLRFLLIHPKILSRKLDVSLKILFLRGLSVSVPACPDSTLWMRYSMLNFLPAKARSVMASSWFP